MTVTETPGTTVSAEVTVVDQAATAHGLVAEATHHDFLSEPETDDEIAVLKLLTIPRCLVAATTRPSRFRARKLPSSKRKKNHLFQKSSISKKFRF
jgi:hypothetical protein